jgi:hypothetical protein
MSAVTGSVKLQLKLEGAALAAVALLLYARLDAGWGLFAALFLVPDVSFAGYLFGPRVGAASYNALHALLGPAALAAVGVVLWPAALPVALIWFAHIGVDRALGYGLKYPGGFSQTHLGRVGRAAPAQAR